MKGVDDWTHSGVLPVFCKGGLPLVVGHEHQSTVAPVSWHEKGDFSGILSSIGCI